MDPIGGPGQQAPAPDRDDLAPRPPTPAREAAPEEDVAVPAQIGEDPGDLGPGWDDLDAPRR